jgi:hypothetical protein
MVEIIYQFGNLKMENIENSMYFHFQIFKFPNFQIDKLIN